MNWEEGYQDVLNSFEPTLADIHYLYGCLRKSEAREGQFSEAFIIYADIVKRQREMINEKINELNEKMGLSEGD